MSLWEIGRFGSMLDLWSARIRSMPGTTGAGEDRDDSGQRRRHRRRGVSARNLAAVTLGTMLVVLVAACSPSSPGAPKTPPSGSPTDGRTVASSPSGPPAGPSRPAQTSHHRGGRIDASVFGKSSGVVWAASDTHGGSESGTWGRVPRGRYAVDVACRTGSAVAKLNDMSATVHCDSAPVTALQGCITSGRADMDLGPVGKTMGAWAEQLRRTGPC